MRWASALGCLLLMAGCRQSGTWVDNQIDPSVRSTLRSLNTNVISYITAKDTAQLKDMFSDSLLAHVGPTFVSQVEKNQVLFDLSKYRSKNEFYIVYTGAKSSSHNVHRGKGNEHDYLLNFQPMTEETLVSLGFFQGTPESFALTTSYGKYGGNWKLNIMEIGLLKVMNGDAVDWYHRAKRDFDSGYLADAANDLVIMEQLMKPAGELLHYEKENEMNELDQRLTAAIAQRYPFPMTDSLVKTKPSIFRIALYRAPEAYYPFVLYRTTLPLTDTMALSRECDAINARLGQMFKGLPEGKRFIYYRVYTKVPGDTTDAYKEFHRSGIPPFVHGDPPDAAASGGMAAAGSAPGGIAPPKP